MKNEDFKISELYELSTEPYHEMKLKISDNLLEALGQNAKEILTEELVKKLVEYMFNDIHKSLDYGKITSEVQQSIINKLTIKELRESLGSEE